MKVKVKCTLIVTVEMPDYFSEQQARFDIEDNSCPGTHAVGAAIENTIAEHEETSTCWACALKGKNEVIAFE